MTQDTIGIDISKTHFDAHWLADGVARRFENTPDGLAAFRRMVGGDAPARIVYEASGPYHRLLERGLGGRLALVRVNPWQARRFAEACGQRAKTDPLDAKLLARMGAALALEPDRPEPKSLTEMKELRTARQALVRVRAGEKTRRQTCHSAILREQIDARIALLGGQIARLDREIASRIDADPQTRRAREILCSIPGVSGTTAAALLSSLPELGRCSAGQIAALAGLAPMVRQSGKWQGKAHIRGGRAALRAALYMPAVSATRHNPELAAFFTRLKARGKPGKLALTAVMRKLVVLANTLIAQNREWRPKPA